MTDDEIKLLQASRDECLRRCHEYEALLLRWRAASEREAWQEGETMDVVESALVYATGTIRLERSLKKKK